MDGLVIGQQHNRVLGISDFDFQAIFVKKTGVDYKCQNSMNDKQITYKDKNTSF